MTMHIHGMLKGITNSGLSSRFLIFLQSKINDTICMYTIFLQEEVAVLKNKNAPLGISDEVQEEMQYLTSSMHG